MDEWPLLDKSPEPYKPPTPPPLTEDAALPPPPAPPALFENPPPPPLSPPPLPNKPLSPPHPKIEERSLNIQGNGGNHMVVVIPGTERTNDRTGTSDRSCTNDRTGISDPSSTSDRTGTSDPSCSNDRTGTNDPSSSESTARSFKEWFHSARGDLLPDGVIQLRVAVCGFAFYGIMALLGITRDLIKNFSVPSQVLVFLAIGIIWAITVITIGVTMSARTAFGHAWSHHGTRLALTGISLLLLFNIGLMLPQSFWREEGDLSTWSAVATVVLLCVAVIGLIISWVLSCIGGEADRKPIHGTE